VLCQHAVDPFLGSQSLCLVDQLLQMIEHILMGFIIKHDKSIEFPINDIYLRLSHGLGSFMGHSESGPHIISFFQAIHSVELFLFHQRVEDGDSLCIVMDLL
jgi:hypothetical protein